MSAILAGAECVGARWQAGGVGEHAATIRGFWEATEARDWDALSVLLDDDLVYEMEQTRERVTGKAAFLRFFAEFPGDWHLTVRRVVADEVDSGVSIVDFMLDGQAMTGISFFTFGARGAVTRIEDVWPEPYEPPSSRSHLTERF
jgi:ketosteroid isomerase-like protein